jgi:NAD-dependent deacetylase
MLDPSIMLEAERASQLARTMLVVGTSALVQPANLLPLISKNAGARVIEFNIEPTALTQYIDESYFGPAGKVLPVWWEENQNKFSL